MKYILGNLKITEVSVKLQKNIIRKDMQDYFYELLNSFSKNLKM